MTNTESEILAALKRLEAEVSAVQSEGRKPNLLPLFTKLDQLTLALPKNSDPTLLHYLHKKSYQKARLHLEGREAENIRGNCA